MNGKVLIVEDEPIVALDLSQKQSTLRGCGRSELIAIKYARCANLALLDIRIMLARWMNCDVRKMLGEVLKGAGLRDRHMTRGRLCGRR